MAERRAEIICDELFFERSSDIDSNDKTNLLRTVINGLPDIVSLQKPDHTVLFYNEAGYRFLGRRPDQVDGKKCFELIGRSAPCELCATREATISRKTETIEKYLPEYGVWMETRAIPVLNGEGAVEMTIEILRDTTDSRRMMRELQKSEERFRTLFEEANVAIVLHDKDTGRVIDANLATLRRYGLSSVWELETNDFWMEPPYSFNEALEWIHKADREGPQRFEWLNRRATGELFWEDVLLSKIVIGGKERILATTIDITERKKLEEQMLHSQKMEAVGTLAGGVAHDFNNLLMSILGYASMLLMKTEQTHPFYEKLKTIERQVESGAELTRQLLGFAQGGRYETKPIWLNELLTKTSNVFGKTKKEIVVHTKLQGNLYAIEADEGQIEQVLMNLYMNASQAMPSGGDLYIETENVELLEYFCLPHGITPGAYIKISITDTGEGMDPETRRRIFEPFFTTREVGKGTGLGLASAYGIVRNHGGAINVYSEKRHGSKFSS